jgi:predicted PurR-regulated permease PerM
MKTPHEILMKPARSERIRLSSTAPRILAGFAIGALLYFAHAVFIPVALAVLFSLILTTPVELLHRSGLPRSAAAVVVLVVIASLLSGSLNLLWAPAQHWWAAAPQTLRIIEQKVRPVAQFMDRIETLTNRAGQITDAAAMPAARLSARTATLAVAQPTAPVSSSITTAQAPRTNVTAEVLSQTRAAIVSTATVTILILFLLAGGPPMLARMTAAMAHNLQSTHTLRIIDAVRSEVSAYYASIALINIGLGLATAAVMMILGVPNPLLWGAVAAILNFIPYVGSATTLLLLIVVAFVTFDDLGRVAAVGASYLALATIEGQVVQPLVVGRRLKLNPIIVFLALWFGGWFWGIAGIIIAVPGLVALKVVAEHSKQGKPLAEFLSPNETPQFHASPVRAIIAQGRSRGKPPS